MNKHTPGPWEATKKNGIAGPDGKSIAAISSTVARDWDVKQANARLIASAPELLEALQGLLAWADDIHAGKDVRINYAGTDAARSAIAKAKGEQHV